MVALRRVKLEQSLVSQVYLERLQRALSQFVAWTCLAHTGVAWEGDLDRTTQFLAEFIQHLYDTNKPLYIARHAILAVEYKWPSMKGALNFLK